MLIFPSLSIPPITAQEQRDFYLSEIRRVASYPLALLALVEPTNKEPAEGLTSPSTRSQKDAPGP